MSASGLLPTLPRDDLRIPSELSGIAELVLNLRWTWDRGQADLLGRINPTEWASSRDPIAAIRSTTAVRWSELQADAGFRGVLGREQQRLRSYLTSAAAPGFAQPGPVAYFCAEYGLHESIPLYAGGLGILAGDTCKAASDRGLDLVAVGLLYREGGFEQSLDEDGRQLEQWRTRTPESMPVARAAAADGTPLNVAVPIADRQVAAAVWIARVGRVPLVLLETDVAENYSDDRRITDRLYVADRRTRLRQEIVLGVGGARALDALAIDPAVHHLNEGHAALLLLELARRARPGVTSASEALDHAGARSVFTVHTPVPAGNESFELELVNTETAALTSAIGLSSEDLAREGQRPGGLVDHFDLTALAMRHCAMANGVSRLHAKTASATWAEVRGGPLLAVTNGVHRPTWQGPAVSSLMDGPTQARGDDLWTAHLAQKGALAEYPELAGRMLPDALIIGFARRFAPYKRASLMLHDADRLARLLANPERPVQILIAGRAHHADLRGGAMLSTMARAAAEERFAGRLILLENYGMELAAALVAGVDLWLNTPRRPMEASGTSGMKAGLNGIPSLSILDGWWDEGYSESNGWAIGPRMARSDAADADDLYRLLESVIVPTFFDRTAAGSPKAWTGFMMAALDTALDRFTTDRMLDDLVRDLYGPVWSAHAP
jgi:glucan phosphorylase